MAESLLDDVCLDPDAVAAFLTGDLAPGPLRALESHVDRCSACRELLSALAKSGSLSEVSLAAISRWQLSSPSLSSTVPYGASDVQLPAGARVGRYLVLEPLGTGGMGIVYAARDPELNRRVALKLLRNDAVTPVARGALAERLLREAQAMARLAHPNVVAVHDVGSHGDQIFIAMEMVDGQTLAAWLSSARRSWREVVAVFLPAGHGLVAAHAAGLVHRDFKPENVLVGDDGRVRVTDFGLARSALVPPTAPTAASPSQPDASAQALTVTGALVGTPFFMAPEQFLGRPIDARSDQFSFCVALWFALTGQHPFAGDNAASLAKAVTEGQLRPPPRRDRLPRWLRRVLLRGLSVDANRRYPSMAALLQALEHDPRRAVMRATAAAMVVLTLVGGSVIYRRHSARLMCQGGERKLTNVWDRRRAAAVERAFAKSGAPGAAAAFAQVARALDDYTARWVAVHTDACEATRVRGEQSEELYELRAACLDVHLRNIRALSDRLANADAALVARAPGVVAALGDLGDCIDPRRAAACGRSMDEFDWCAVGHEGTGDAEQHEGLTEFRGRVIQLRAKHYAGEDEGNIVRNYRPGDLVWVDVSTDQGRSWLRCGPYSSDRTMWVPHRGNWLRVCLDADGETQCATNGNARGPDGSYWWSYTDGPC
jgi:serine/threonine protein kinase